MRIYLVDNDPFVTLVLQDFLSKLGHEAVAFDAADHLLDSLEENARLPDLVISDKCMAVRNGLKFLREAHRRLPGVHFLLIMSNGTNGHNRAALPPDEAVALGVYAYLHKPFELAELEFLLLRLSEQFS